MFREAAMAYGTRRELVRTADGEPYVLDLGRFIDDAPLAAVPRAGAPTPPADRTPEEDRCPST